MVATSKKKKPQGGKQKDGPKFNKASKKPFKSKKKDSGDSGLPAAEGAALQPEDDVPDFPRGGGSTLSQNERDEIHAEVDAEFETEKMVLMKKSKKGKKPRRKSDSGPDDLGSLFGNALTGKLPRFANKITLKNISPGMKLWGVVTEVNEKDLVISLPGGLRGLVRSTDALDPLDDEIQDNERHLPSKFSIGQLVACTVLQLDDDKKDGGKRKIWLSLRLSLLHKGFSFDSVQEGMVLTAYIKSIEDHGYFLDFGLPSFTGFLLKNNDAGGASGVIIGQLQQGVVTRINKAQKVVHLSSDPDTVSKCVMKDIKGISIDSLVPGVMVNARVQSTLENGVMLSFLTYFSGTVDMFHLQNTFPASNWKDDYSKNKKVNARILFIDPSTRAVGLTLNHHLLHNRAPSTHAKVGDICDDAKVVRVDRGLGLLLEIPSTPVSAPAFVSISEVAEDGIQKLEKQFREGSIVRVRILGLRQLEGVATGTLKASAFEGPVFTHSDVKPGMVVRAKITAIEKSGNAIVQFAGGVKALCPLRHMSEFEISKPRKKFKVGAELLFRVLGCKSKRITVTHKKTLVKSKLPIISSYADATDGLITHGWITKIEKHGCFVHFYNGVQGFAPRSELGLEPGSDANSIYQVGQVVKCRVISSLPGSRRINLSFMMRPTRVSEEEAVKLGSVLSGVVEKVMPFGVVVYVNAKGYLKGTISTEHLSDHHEFATLMKSVLKPGHEFHQLLVLDIESNNLILSAKYSLINSAPQLPADLSEINSQSVVQGYICNIIETGCFIRYLGRLTGFSPRSKATDDKRVQLAEAFYIGQSVRSNILDVDKGTNRITVSLKQSSCSSMDASFLRGYFLSEEKIVELQSSDSKGSDSKWVETFNIGNVVEGKIQESKEFGLVVGFNKYQNVLGFITNYQLGGMTAEVGSAVEAVVLDVAKTEHLVDLSLKPEFLKNSMDESSNNKSNKKKRKREASKEVELHQTVNAVVEIVKENYLVLSIPEHNYAIGYASLSDYNIQKFPQKKFLPGQSVIATVVALPSPSSSERLLLLLKSISEVTETSSLKKAKKKSSYAVGSLVQAELTEIRPLEMRLKFGIGFHGRIHITQVNDTCASENPFSDFKIGQTVTARIIAKAGQLDKKKSQLWELSIRPKLLADGSELGDKLMSEEFDFSLGQHVTGYVYKADGEWAWLGISPHARAQLFILDSACEPSELQEFHKRFYVGKMFTGYVLSVNKEKKSLRLVQHPLCAESNRHSDGKTVEMNDEKNNVLHENITAYIHEGDIVGGRISKVLPGVGGLIVQIGPHLHGRVHFTEIQDSWVPNPLSGFCEGQFVKCKVLEINHSAKGTVHVDLSLRSSLDGMLTENSTELCNAIGASKRVEKIEDLHPNMVVQGYVKNIMSKGCFILLSRKLDAKILLSNLSDGFVDNPEKEFPVGKLVTGRVLSVEPFSKRVEVTLKNASDATKSDINDLSSLHVGEIISGIIKRVESYGLFIAINHTNMVGLCHISELSDDRIDNIETRYKAGEKVTARILKVDLERGRISLGMKNLDAADDDLLPSRDESDESMSEDGSRNDSDSQLIILADNCPNRDQNVDIKCENEVHFLAQAESRASVPPLEVNLDDIEQFNMDELMTESKEQNAEAEEDNKRQEKKKAKEREQEIRAAEERMMEKDIPRSADEFEKLVRSSPNSSFVWIKYMAFMLNSAEIEKARSIAERALRTINIREENEKLNIWVAYLNLENEYGDPPEEAVKKLFQRAVLYCDSKTLHLALLGMYERTGQDKLADELLDKMVKQFKHSCKIWLKRIQRLLQQKQDGVQSVVQRALLHLPRHKHIKFISQAAILEFKLGVPDRGRSMFEGILREYPKRTDLWSIYLDQEIRLQDVEVIRGLFERATSLSLPAKKIKFLFKKYLAYEKSHGDEERIEYVKRKALEYAERM